MTSLRSRKYLLLTIVLVAVAVLQSFTRRAVLGPIFSDAVVALVLLAVFQVVFDRRHERALAFVALAAALAAMLAHYILSGAAEYMLRIAYHALSTVFLGLAVATILRNVFRQQVIRTDDVLGAVSGYLLAAGAWANLYAFTEALVPGSFAVASTLEHDLASWHGRIALFEYFSLVTLTTMGYGDVTPVRPPATAFATLEAVFGQFYIAVVVAQLVGARLAQPAAGNAASRD